jgi:hypothetical protein
MRFVTSLLAAAILLCAIVGCSGEKGELAALRAENESLKSKLEDIEKTLATTKERQEQLEKELAELKKPERQLDPRAKYAQALVEEYLRSGDRWGVPNFMPDYCTPDLIQRQVGIREPQRYAPLKWSITASTLSPSGDEAIITGSLTTRPDGGYWHVADPVAFTIRVARDKKDEKWRVDAATFVETQKADPDSEAKLIRAAADSFLKEMSTRGEKHAVSARGTAAYRERVNKRTSWVSYGEWYELTVDPRITEISPREVSVGGTLKAKRVSSWGGQSGTTQPYNGSLSFTLRLIKGPAEWQVDGMEMMEK